ncbi:MAG: PTS sugar transporter subunit IIA [Treponema sp.]|jgi:PTS system nitrogen regulatory IIA component|nr:PTS sugar transporter subunit IIA [Treponema sp.]
MLSKQVLCGLISRGGVFAEIEGTTVADVYLAALRKMHLPDYLSPEVVQAELLEREKILSTAVGNSIAIPHPRRSLITLDEDQRVGVFFLKEPLVMSAPDGRPVTTLFLLLTAKTSFHFETLSSLAALIQHDKFKTVLKSVPNEWQLCDAICNCSL